MEFFFGIQSCRMEVLKSSLNTAIKSNIDQSPTDITDGATTFAVLMQNIPQPQNQNWRNSSVSIITSVNELEELTGLDFFSNIPDEIEEVIESYTDTSIIS